MAKAAICIAMTTSREEKMKLKISYSEKGIQSLAVDYGGEFLSSLQKVAERAVLATKREGIIDDSSHSDGAVAGATGGPCRKLCPRPWV